MLGTSIFDRLLPTARRLCPVLLCASLWLSFAAGGADVFPEETAYRVAFDSSRIALKARVVNPAGTPLPGCTARMASGDSTVTGPDGTFVIPGLLRSNQLLTVSAAGHYRQLLPVRLFVPLAQAEVTVPPVVLWPETPAVVRYLFGGDTAFARRMLDPEGRAARDEMPLENPDALISVSDPLPGTFGVVGFVRPLFLAVDYPVLNFESAVTLDPSTPHWQKSFVYFTLPASLAALHTLNIDYVALGNNHTYDYLEAGVSDTRRYFDEAGIHYSGLGSNSAAAFTPYRVDIKGTPASFLAMTSIGGEQHATNYVAGTDKGGAAYIESRAEAQRAIAAEKAAGRVTILQPHVGDEYTYEPSVAALKWMKFGVDSGADLIVSHHTHIAQGFGLYRGVLLIHCLGNLFFDQDRLETMVGLTATVDMEGRRLRRAWGTPVYLEDYRPRFISGGITPVLLRRVAEYSQQLRVFPYNGQAWVADRPDLYSFADRRVIVPLAMPTNGWAVLDLRGLAAPDESLARVETDALGLSVRQGRDLMLFGDFEDLDLDSENGETSRWDFSASGRVALKEPYRGTAALCLHRSRSSLTEAMASFRNRARVVGDSRNTPNKNLSLLGYVRGQDAGAIRVLAGYYASEGTLEFGQELAFAHPGGTFPWQAFAADLHLPPDNPSLPGNPPAVNARAVRVFLRHSPTPATAGYAWFDEFAVVSWEESLMPWTGPAFNTPHARDFLRVEGAPGNYQLALTFRRHRPIEAEAGHGPELALEAELPGQSADRLWFPPTGVGTDELLSVLVRNQGNEPLVVSNLTFVGGRSADYLARWLEANDLPVQGSALTLPPRGAARLEVRFAPMTAGSSEAVLQFDSNDPDESQSRITLVIGGSAFAGSPVRSLSFNRSPAPTIRIRIPPSVGPGGRLREHLPPGVMPTLVSDGGRWDAAARVLEWPEIEPGAFVSYSLTGSDGAHPLTGEIVLSERTEPTQGEANVLVATPPDADSDGLPDWWELKFFDTRTGAVPEVDSDGDGRSNLEEFRAGTHPLDGGFQSQRWAPYLRHRRTVDTSAELEVLGSEGATYRIERSVDLVNWQSVSTDLPSGEIFSMPLPDPNPAGGERLFLRAVLEER